MREIIVTENLDRYTIINRVEDFYLAKDNLYKGKGGNVVVVFEYDGGYQYYGVYLDDLLDFDVDKFVEQWFDNIAKIMIDTHPYTKKFDLEKLIGKDNIR